MKVGGTIRALRNNLDLSAAKLSRLADIHVNSLYKVEDDEVSPSLSQFGKIAKALHLEPWQILKAVNDEEYFEIIADKSYAAEEIRREFERDEDRMRYYDRD